MWKIIVIVAVVAAIITLTNCSTIKLKIANTLAAKGGDYTVTHDIAYGEETRQKLDIYQPKDATKNRPVIVFFYGGSWQDGAKAEYEFAAQPLVDAGYVVVIPDYAKYPEHKYPAFLEDGASAVHWVVDTIDQYQGDATNITLMGHSAGGYIAAMLAANEQYLGDNIDHISAMVGLSGAYDFVPKAEDIKAIFAPAASIEEAMPSHYINGGEPPMLLLWGAQDSVVGERNINRFSRTIQQQNGEVKTIVYPDLNHAGTVAALAIPKRESAPVLADILSFLNQHVK